MNQTQEFIDLLNNHTALLQELQSQLLFLSQSSAAKDVAYLESVDDLSAAINVGWLLVCTYLVFFMQLGFALLEAGTVTAINLKNILMQNTLDVLLSLLVWWAWGYAIYEGYYSLGWGSMTEFFTHKTEGFPVFLFLWAFNNCSATIVSGAVTSRIKFSAYLAIVVVISGFTFPIVAYWTWGKGVLSMANPDGLGVIDFAGGTVVHMIGGFSALVGSIVVGPRCGRFSQKDDGTWQDNREPGHNIGYSTIGTMVLFFGWMGFNSGSTQALANGSYLVAAACALNTLLAPSAAGLVITVYFVKTRGVHELGELLNAILCGLVAITPCCATVPPWAAVVIGAFSVFPYIFAVKMLSRLRIDDVVDAFPVHGCCGVYGTLCAGLFSNQSLIDAAYGTGRINYNVGYQFGIQLLAVVMCLAITVSAAFALFYTLKHTIGVRVTESDERVGLDFKYHAGYAFADFNQRVKKAHQQMALEAEIAVQVRKTVAAGKGNRFKDVLNTGQSPLALKSKPFDNDHIASHTKSPPIAAKKERPRLFQHTTNPKLEEKYLHVPLSEQPPSPAQTCTSPLSSSSTLTSTSSNRDLEAGRIVKRSPNTNTLNEEGEGDQMAPALTTREDITPRKQHKSHQSLHNSPIVKHHLNSSLSASLPNQVEDTSTSTGSSRTTSIVAR